MDGENNGKPYENGWFGDTPIFWKHRYTDLYLDQLCSDVTPATPLNRTHWFTRSHPPSMDPTQKKGAFKMHPKQKVVKNYCKTHKPLKSDGWNMTCPFKNSPFFRRYGWDMFIFRGGRMPHPNKAFEGLFFFGGVFWTLQTQVDHGPNGLAEKRGAGFGKKPGGLIFGFFGSPLGVISLWCFSMNLMQIGDIFGIFWLHRFGLQRLILLVVVFLDVFLEGIFAPKTRGDDSIGRIFSWESKGTHPMDD